MAFTFELLSILLFIGLFFCFVFMPFTDDHDIQRADRSRLYKSATKAVEMSDTSDSDKLLLDVLYRLCECIIPKSLGMFRLLTSSEVLNGKIMKSKAIVL